MKKQHLLLIFFLSPICFIHAQSFLQRDSLANNEEFRARVKIAMVTAAGQVLSDTSAAGIEQQPFAGRIVSEPNSSYFLDQFTYQVVANPAINENSSDSDIQFTVNSNFAKLAGEYTRQRSGAFNITSPNVQALRVSNNVKRE